MTFLFVITILFSGFTLIQLFYYLVLFRVKEDEIGSSESYASVIIATHNNLEGLLKLIEALKKQIHSHFEIIIASDRNNENYNNSLRSLEASNKNLSIIFIKNCPTEWSPKKYALTEAIKQAKHDSLVFIDDDCLPASDQWLGGMVNALDNSQIAIGYSPHVKTPTFLSGAIWYETTLTALQYLGLAQKGSPFMAVGRNWAYSKSTFLRSGGFAETAGILSGDDDLLLQSMTEKAKARTVFAAKQLVHTAPAENLKNWWRQKTRHNSAGWHYKPAIKWKLGFYVLSHVGFWTLLLVAVFSNHLSPVIIAGLILRTLVIFIIFGGFAAISKELSKLKWLLLFDLIYPFYIVMIGVSSFFAKKVKWN